MPVYIVHEKTVTTYVYEVKAANAEEAKEMVESGDAENIVDDFSHSSEESVVVIGTVAKIKKMARSRTNGKKQK